MEILHSLLALHDLAALPEGKIKKLLTYLLMFFIIINVHNSSAVCLPSSVAYGQ